MKLFSTSPRAWFFAAFLFGVVGLSLPISMNAIAGHNTKEALEARVIPEGKLNVLDRANSSVSGSAAVPRDAATVYNSGCAACHGAGIAGAPRTGDASAWRTRIKQGMAVLVEHAINGFQGNTGVMPAKGGNPTWSDEEVEAAVRYMIEQSQ